MKRGCGKNQMRIPYR